MAQHSLFRKSTKPSGNGNGEFPPEKKLPPVGGVAGGIPLDIANTRRILIALTRRRVRIAQYSGDPGYLRQALGSFLVNDLDYDDSAIIQAIRNIEGQMGPIGRASVMEAGWLNSPDNILSVAGGEERFIRSLQAIMDRCPMSWDMVILLTVTIVHVAFQAFEAEHLELMAAYVRWGCEFFERRNINAWIGAIQSGWYEVIEHSNITSNVLGMQQLSVRDAPPRVASPTSRNHGVGDAIAGPSGLQALQTRPSRLQSSRAVPPPQALARRKTGIPAPLNLLPPAVPKGRPAPIAYPAPPAHLVVEASSSEDEESEESEESEEEDFPHGRPVSRNELEQMIEKSDFHVAIDDQSEAPSPSALPANPWPVSDYADNSTKPKFGQIREKKKTASIVGKQRQAPVAGPAPVFGKPPPELTADIVDQKKSAVPGPAPVFGKPPPGPTAKKVDQKNSFVPGPAPVFGRPPLGPTANIVDQKNSVVPGPAPVFGGRPPEIMAQVPSKTAANSTRQNRGDETPKRSIWGLPPNPPTNWRSPQRANRREGTTGRPRSYAPNETPQVPLEDLPKRNVSRKLTYTPERDVDKTPSPTRASSRRVYNDDETAADPSIKRGSFHSSSSEKGSDEN